MTTLDDVLAEIRLLRQELTDRPARPAKMLTLVEAAEMLDVSTVTLRRWVRDGKIKSKGKGRGLRFSIDDVQGA